LYCIIINYAHNDLSVFLPSFIPFIPPSLPWLLLHRWSGSDAVAFLERVTVGDIAGMRPGQSKLSLILNATGGIVDDTVLTKAGDCMHMVVNGACKHKDIDHFKRLTCDYTLSVHSQ
jgi:glycine cleavage system aminomethyltransferase T